MENSHTLTEAGPAAGRPQTEKMYKVTEKGGSSTAWLQLFELKKKIHLYVLQRQHITYAQIKSCNHKMCVFVRTPFIKLNMGMYKSTNFFG